MFEHTIHSKLVMTLLSFQGSPGDYTLVSNSGIDSPSIMLASQQVELINELQRIEFKTLVDNLSSQCLDTATSKAYQIIDDTTYKSEPKYLELYQGKITQVSMPRGYREEIVKNEFTVDDMQRIEDASYGGILCGSCNPFAHGDGMLNHRCRGLYGIGCHQPHEKQLI